MKLGNALTFLLVGVTFCNAGVTLDSLDNNGVTKGVGLTEGEKKTLLDEHNRLRALQAKGEVPGQPSAADMVRLEWSDASAEHAQTWANNCGGPMHGNHAPYGEGQDYAGNGARNRLIVDAFKGWFDDEYPGYTYGSPPGASGHYTQIVTAFSTKVGCGANKCPGETYGRLICNFFVGGNLFGKPPFTKGPACSKCPKGYGYCKDSLCTSHGVCAGDSSCRCTVDAAKCGEHGTFDASTCQCKCKTGWDGLNCEKVCEDPADKMCQPRANEGECKPSAKNQFFVDMIMNCKAACGFCKAACKNKADNCADLKSWGNCKKSKPYMEIFCQKECGFCS